MAIAAITGMSTLTTGYSTTGTWTTVGSLAGCLGGQAATISTTSGGNTASFVLSGLTAGTLYQVQANWYAHATGATGQTWQILDTDGSTVLASGTYACNVDPTADLWDCARWQNMAQVTPTGTSLTFKVTTVTQASKTATISAARAAAVGNIGTSFSVTSGLVIGQTSTGTLSGRTDQVVNTDTYVILEFTGTDLTISSFQNAAINWSLDGGATFTSVSPASTGKFSRWAPAGLQGLSDAAHTVILRGGQWWLDLSHSFTVYGSSPAVAIPAAYNGTWHGCGANPSYMTVDRAGTRFTGGTSTGQVYWTPVSTRTGWGHALRFRAKVKEIKVFAYMNNNKYALSVDGGTIGTAVVMGSNSWFGFAAFSGLDDTAYHEYRVWGVLGAFPNFAGVLALSDTGGGIDTTPLTDLPLLAVEGDSISSTMQSGTSNFSLIWSVQLANQLRVGLASTATASTGWIYTTGSSTGQTRASEIVGFAPDVVLTFLGVNDLIHTDTTGTTAADYQAAITNAMSTYTTGLPSAKIIVVGPYDVASTVYDANYASFLAAQQAAVAANGSANITSADAHDWINGTTYNSSTNPTGDLYDGLHIMPDREYKVANGMAPLVTAALSGTAPYFLIDVEG